jgi:AGZA family xanthine/uracil permease-like MFS transporter
MTCGLCFLVTMFFAPIFASIPPWATGCTLILVSNVSLPAIFAKQQSGWLSYDASNIQHKLVVYWRRHPCLRYHHVYSFWIQRCMVYTGLNGMIYITKVVSGGRIVPEDEDNREYWTSKSHCFFSQQR